MKFNQFIFGLVLILLISCKTTVKQDDSILIKQEIKQRLLESSQICQLLDCQAKFSKEVIIYRDLYKDLHNRISKFVDTSYTKIPRNDDELDSLLNKFEPNYHYQLDVAIKSVKYKLFPENDTFYIYSSFFRPDTSTTSYPEKYYKTCKKTLDEHLRILKAGQPTFSHDPCVKNLPSR